MVVIGVVFAWAMVKALHDEGIEQFSLAPAQLLLIVILAAVFGVVDGFFLPAVGAAPAFVTDEQGQTRLQALRTIVYRGAPMVGAPLAGALLIAFGAGLAYAAQVVRLP